MAPPSPFCHTRVMAITNASDVPPLPLPDEVSHFFWDGCAEHKLLIQRCLTCSRYEHPPEGRLAPRPPGHRSWRRRRYRDEPWWTPSRFRSQPFDPYYAARVPYTLAVVELIEQKRLKRSTNIVDIDPDDVTIGMPVRATFREVAAGVTLPLFSPIAE